MQSAWLQMASRQINATPSATIMVTCNWLDCPMDHIAKTCTPLYGHCIQCPVPGEFSAQRSVTRSFDVFFDLHLNKQLSKQSRCWWFETPSGSLWRQCNVFARLSIHSGNSRWSYFNEILDDIPCMSFRFGFNNWLHNGHLLVNICTSDCTQYVHLTSDVMFGLFWPAIPSIWRSPHSPMSPLFNNAGYCDSMERAPWFKVVLICVVKAKHFINPFAAPPISKSSYASDKLNTTTILFIY